MFNLSEPQKAIYYMSVASEDSTTNVAGDVFFDFEVSVEAARRTAEAFLNSCSIMHTRIFVRDGIPMQKIEEKYIAAEDIEVKEFDNYSQYEKWGRADAAKPINIYGCLYRLYVVKIGQKVGFYCVTHHIINDATSFNIMASFACDYLKENKLITIYPYTEYIKNEESYKFSKRYEKDKSFWIDLYNSRDDEAYVGNQVMSGKSSRKRIITNRNLSEKIKQYCLSCDNSEFSVLLAVVALWYHKNLQKDSFFIGSPMLNRSSLKEEQTFGLFVNTVPIPFLFYENLSFEELCMQTNDLIMSAFRHQKYHYTQLLKDIGSEKNNRQNLFDVVVSYMNVKTANGAHIGWFNSGKQNESLQIHIEDRENDGVFKFYYDYRTDKYSEKDIEKLHCHFLNLISNALEHPDKKISELEMLSADEKQKLLCDFNSTAVDYPRDKCIHELFEEQVRRTPDKIAVIACDKTLTYRELNEEANKIAHSLTENGVGRGDIVAFNLPRRGNIVAAMLGILKSGAAYLPLDPDYPQERIEYILSDSNAKFCVTEENISELTENKDKTNPVIESNSGDICYCIYTSGSTGTPKGTLIRHNNVVNFCSVSPANNLQSYIAHECETVLACGSIVFDISNFEIILSLLLNKSVVLANETELSHAKELAVLIEKNSVDCVHCTPTKLKTYFESREFASAFRNIECVMVGGEQFSKDIYDTIRSCGNAKIFNGYGPTETTMGVSFGEIDGALITIGKPIANSQIYILDKYMKLVPVGVTGELCIAGDCVGAGYLNRPELTAEKFIDNPFGEGKLYKTGDLAYWREDGNIVFVGRSDFQVKIRGLRIELGEIEGAISEIEGINQSVVIVRKDSEDRQFLCAFYTGEEKSTKEIRAELSAKLPRYMVPHIFTYLPEMPLTASGKANRNALPEVDLEKICADTEYIAPATEEEKVLAQAVSSVLKAEKVNMLDNFFNIGGDSIKAIYLVSEIEEAGYELHVADVMQSDTLSNIAAVMKSTSDRAMYEQNEVNGIIPYTPIMRTFINENGTIPDDFVHNCVITADCDADTARKVFDALVSRHDMLRGTFVEKGIEIHPSEARDAYSFEPIHISDAEEAKKYLSRIRVEGDKLVNVMYCTTAEGSLIGITVHHFLIDLVSWEILMKDFRTATEQLKNGDEINLPAKTASFKLWSEELENYAKAIPDEGRDYWKNIDIKLDSAKPFCSDNDKEIETEYCIHTFSKEFSDKLLNEANTAYGTRSNEILLAALGLASVRLAEGAVGIIVEGHGRTELHKSIAIDRTVGWFTTCYPVVFEKDSSETEALIETKEAMRRIPKNGVDYLLLREGFHKNTDIIFNYYRSDMETGENGIVAFNSGAVGFKGKISVDCSVTDGLLSVSVVVPCGRHREMLAKELIDEFVKQVEKLVEICTETCTAVRTISDFSDNALTEAEFFEITEHNSTIKDIYDLTPSQEGIYAQYFRNPDTRTYRLQNLCRISRTADLEMLGKSVELLSVRHEVLKAAFFALKSTGAIKQVILENRSPEYKVIEKQEAFSQRVLDELVAVEGERAFDLKRDSLFRVIVIDFSDERFILTITHHIIIDGWCLPVIIRDLQRYYGRLEEGISSEVLAAEIRKEASTETSYSEYVRQIRSRDRTEASEYWNELLADSTASHIFGREKKDNSKNEEIVTFTTSLDEVTIRNIERFARENRVSHNTVFEGAFSVALQKYSGSEDVIFDKVISGRSVPIRNIDKTVGLFINTVPVRIRTSAETTFADTVKEIHRQTVASDNYGVLSLADVYKAGGIDSNAVDSLFVFENYYTGESSEIMGGSLLPELVSFDEQTEFNLTVTVFKEGHGYAIRTSYAKEMYTQEEITEFSRGYISILRASLESDRKIIDITVTDTALLKFFNETVHSYDMPEKSTLYSLFEKTAKDNAEKICIKTAEGNLTFGEICCISENLDAEIRKITDNKKSVIAVIAERSVEMYAAIYGIIRGGNAYLPIDPNYPQDRIEYILKNSNAAAVVCQGKFAHLVGNTPYIDMSEFIINTQKSDNVPDCRAEENDTAYVIYTSGSTGTPKGAKVSHKSAVNRILWMHDRYPLHANDVILQKTPYTFDVSVWELFWWGLCGGSLAVSKPGEHFLPAKILDEVERNKVTHLHFVPSVFEIFLNYLETHRNEIPKFNSVKYVFLSGEALSASLVNRFYKLYDYEKVTLHNLYGPTECAVDVTYYDCTPEDIDPVPIGKPIHNTQIHIVDKYMNLVPVGVQGELCIAGMNVGQGYLNNPVLTEEKFIDNPFGEDKLYKTGDLAYWREDGNIVFVGRKDSQIKLNGQRIELGEIEAVINGISGVSSSSVIVKNINGTDVLIAFYTGDAVDVSSLEECCSVKLPSYMVPGKFVYLDTLPLNYNGKLDRKALVQIDVELLSDEGFMEPENETEKLICEIFCRVLEVENIGRNSDFFRMGGTSLSMISILSEDIFENITAAEFMRNSTPAKLARKIAKPEEKILSYLEPLYISDITEKTLILLPFAGGGAEAFSAFVNSIKKKNALISVYYVRYLHSFEECKRAADEIAEVCKNSEIMFYSHCVGSAVALQIIKELEAKKIPVSHYFAGASIPPAKAVRKNLWNIVPDNILKTILTKAGADISGLYDEKLSEMLMRFRKDTDFANISFSELKGKIKTPVSVIISKKDIFTKNYRQARSLWKKYADNVEQVYYIESDSHYFQSESSERLTDLIVKNIV